MYGKGPNSSRSIHGTLSLELMTAICEIHALSASLAQ